MNKTDYCYNQVVSEFISWFSGILEGNEINFTCTHNKGRGYRHLHEALFAYAWPDREKNKIGKVSSCLFPLPADAGFLQNKKVLEELSSGLRKAKDDTELAEWTAAVMEWGGVERNNEWIRNNEEGLYRRVDELIKFINTNNDDVKSWVQEAKYQDRGLRFNAGWTKVYSLMADKFVIYDSRVAAALAWLACVWAESKGIQLSENGLLSFGCLKANESKNVANPKIRNPNSNVFRNIDSNPISHLHWNIRANWILDESFKNSSATPYENLRELEAALFMLGYALNGARCVQDAATVCKLNEPKARGRITKKAIARKIFEANQGMTRKEVIQKIVAESGLTPQGASTYYHQFKKSQIN